MTASTVTSPELSPHLAEDIRSDSHGPFVVILYNDDHHDIAEVVSQVQLATGYDIAKCAEITMKAHFMGRAIAYSGAEEDCERVAQILRSIRLQVETDRL